MSFPRYPKYKPSGVEWLGEVPEGWRLNRIGHFFAERREQVSDLDFAALSVTKNGIVPQLDSAAKTDNGDNRKKVCAGDFAINSRSDRKGSAGVSELDGSVSVITTVLSPRESVHGPFVHHLLRSQPFQEEFYRFGKGIVADLWSTRYSEMRNIRLAVPPLAEQTAIAEFLDRETGKIDGLVAEQQRLMELLKEKRQAVISHAVTKGLNRHAPMKPSGIEWLGDVPVGWVVCAPKRRIKSAAGGTLIKGMCSDEFSEGLFPGFSASGQNVWLEEYAYDCPAIVLSAVGARCGKAFKADGQWGVVANTHCLFPLANSYRDYLWYLTNQEDWWEKGGSAQPFVKVSETLARPWVFPPLPEQTAIAEFLDTELAKFDTLTAEAQCAIDLLQERRTALISAAVTGQIDVRPQPKN